MRKFNVPKNPKRLKNIEKKFFVFDVETTKLEPQPKNFVFGCMVGFNYRKIFYSVDEFIKELEKPLFKNKYIFAHNAEFDLLTIYGNIYKNLDSKAVFNGKFIMANNNNITFADSLNIYPASVAKIGSIIGKNKIDNTKISSEGLTKSNITELDIEYCYRDCDIIFEALNKIFDMIGQIKITISSISLYDFRINYLKKSLFVHPNVDYFFESYFGGRTEAFKIGVTVSKCYDINSLYPSVMYDMYFPNPENLKHETRIDNKYLNYLLKNREGMVKLTLKHKKHYFGFIPFRDKKLLFPNGTFTTSINFNELRFALKHKVIEIINIDYVVHGERIYTPFHDFIKDKYTLRKNSTNELMKFIYKLLMNSLYGRFAMRIKHTSEYFNEIPVEQIEDLENLDKFYELKMFSAEREDCFLITENEKMKVSFTAIPLFSSYITSEARIKLLGGMLDNIKNRISYCDTDSIFCEKHFIGKMSNELGDWKLEDKLVTEVRGLKNYSYIDSDKMMHDVIKGVSRNSKKISANQYEKLSYLKTKESLRRNKESGSKKLQTKTLTHVYDKRLILKTGQTKPLML